MPGKPEGPASPFFQAVRMGGGVTLRTVSKNGISEEMIARLPAAPRGACVCRGIPFDAARLLVAPGALSPVALAGQEGAVARVPPHLRRTAPRAQS